MVQTYVVFYGREELLESPVKQVLFIAAEIAIPATAIICGVSLGMSGRKLFGWVAALSLLGAWGGGLALLAVTAITGAEIVGWKWVVSLGVPVGGALWLGTVTRNTIVRKL
jgi:hypothetical protein